MKIIESNIPTALGDLIIIKSHLDAVKHEYDQIRLTFHTELFNIYLHTDHPSWPENKIKWFKFLDDIKQLFFSEPPFIMNDGEYPFRQTTQFLSDFGLRPTKVNLANLLCSGQSLNLDKEYIVLTTKVRYLDRNLFDSMSPQFFELINQLSKKYKIVLLGERVVEANIDYMNWTNRQIYGIYPEIIANIQNKDAIVDLTLPALGETSPNLAQIQQDCLIMKEAKFVVTIGIGGNFCMSTSVSNMAIGIRSDNLELCDAVYLNKEYPDAIITKDLGHFFKTMKGYL